MTSNRKIGCLINTNNKKKIKVNLEKTNYYGKSKIQHSVETIYKHGQQSSAHKNLDPHNHIKTINREINDCFIVQSIFFSLEIVLLEISV